MAALNKKVAPKEDEAKALNLDSILGKPKNRVALVGIELEGGWEAAPKGMAVVRDGSVFKGAGDDGSLRRDKYPGMLCGELQIGPFQVARIGKALRATWPKVIDKSCGLHVHQSFDSLYHYVLLADSPAYQETMCEYLTRWAKEEGFGANHDIWTRLSGESLYCQKKFWPQAQMEKMVKEHDQIKFGHRYTAVNYCFSRFATVEIRVLPMVKDVEQAIRGVKRIVDVTNAYLLKVGKTRVKEGGEVKLGANGSRIKLELRKGSIYEEFYED